MKGDRDLAREIAEWFERHRGDKGIWQKPVGRSVREALMRRGNWKNAPRGNPRKGYEEMRRRMGAGGG